MLLHCSIEFKTVCYSKTLAIATNPGYEKHNNSKNSVVLFSLVSRKQQNNLQCLFVYLQSSQTHIKKYIMERQKL